MCWKNSSLNPSEILLVGSSPTLPTNMIKILGDSDYKPEQFFYVSFPKEDFQKITNYLTLLGVDPFEEWSRHQPSWAHCALDREGWGIHENIYEEIAWNKKYENIIHEFNSLFYPDGVCKHNDKNSV